VESAITPADLFIVPFESTKAVKSYANVYALVQRIRGEEPPALHVLSNLSRLPGHRKRVIELMERDGIARAAAEIRTCGWLAQVDEHGGSIFSYRPHANGAKDILVLKEHVLVTLGLNRRPTLSRLNHSQRAGENCGPRIRSSRRGASQDDRSVRFLGRDQQGKMEARLYVNDLTRLAQMVERPQGRDYAIQTLFQRTSSLQRSPTRAS
jgi:hypothetical protein